MKKAKKPKKSKVIYCNRGWQTMFFGFCPNEEAWQREMEKMGLQEPYPQSDACVTFFSRKGKHVAIMTISQVRKSKEEMVGLIVHECTHIWQEVLYHMKEKDKPGAEIEAYSMQAITQEILGAMRQSGVFKL